MSEADSEEPPEIDEEERADVDLDALSDEIEAPEEDEEIEEEPSEDVAEAADDLADLEGKNVGDVYCGGLGVAASLLVVRYDDSRDRKEISTEYESLAREMYLDQFVNEWVREKGHPEDLPPGPAVVVGTVMFLAAVAVTNPAVGEGLMEDLA